MKTRARTFGVGILLACLTSPVAIAQDLLTYERFYNDGQIAERYTYYQDVEEQAVKHGTYESWAYDGTQLILEHYADGERDGLRTAWRLEGSKESETEYQDGKIHGWHRYWAPSGLLQLEQQFKDGQLHGLFRSFYSTGELEAEALYEGGLRNGSTTGYYKEGPVQFRYEYVDDLRHGLTESWQLDGKKTSETHYDQGIRGEGVQWNYHDNGVLKTETPLLDGKYHGTQQEWFENGQLRWRIHFVQGQLHGLAEYWRDTGARQELFTYAMGVKQGPFAYFDDNDQLREEGTLQNGLRHGAAYAYYADGSIQRMADYQHGELDGLRVEWHPNGDLKERSEYSLGLKEGFREIYHADTGVLTHHELFRNDLYHGPATYWYADGQLAQTATFKDGKAHGVEKRYAGTEGGGQIVSLTTWVNGKKHGLFQSYHGGGVLFNDGSYSNDKQCGTWQTYTAQGQLLYDDDFAPCEPLAQEHSYPVLQSGPGGGAPVEAEVRGHVHDRSTRKPVAGAVVTAGAGLSITDAKGFYQLMAGTGGLSTLSCSKDGYYTHSESVSLVGVQYKTVNVDLKVKESGARPGVVSVRSKHGLVFLEGISVPNEYVAAVDWNGGTPDAVRFTVNGTPYEETADAQGATRSFDMGHTFTPSLDLNGNTLRVTAVNRAGVESEPVVLHPIVLPVPDWIKSLGLLTPLLRQGNFVGYILTVNYPVKPLAIQINEEKLGPILWQLWGLFPFVGGRPLGLPPTQAWFELQTKTDGSGSVTLGGKTGWETAGQKIEGKLGGKGNVVYKPGKGLLWNGGSLIVGIEGTLSKDVGVVTVIPALEGAVRLPVIGRPISWFNQRAKIEGKAIVGTELDLQLVSTNAALGFHRASGNIYEGMSLGLIINVTKSLQAEVSGGGTVKAYWQVPANPGYIEKLETELTGKVVLKFWAYEHAYVGSHVFVYPPPAGGGQSVMDGLVYSGLARDDFLRRAHYNQFVQRGISRMDLGAGTAVENLLISNVYPQAAPTLAISETGPMILYVYFDPNDITPQAAEIAHLRSDGNGFTPPALIQDDTRAEYGPRLAFDTAGRGVAAWERVKDPAFPESNTVEQMAAAMEIVTAMYEPQTGLWSEPVALTDNGYLDHGAVLAAGPQGEILVLWQANLANELVGNAATPDSFLYAEWDASTGSFGPTDSLPGTFVDCLSFTAAFDGVEARLCTVQDSDGDLATADDQELFLSVFDGLVWHAPTRLTDNAVSDVHPQIVTLAGGGFEMVWLSGTNLVRMSDWTSGSYESIRQGCTTAGFLDFRLTASGDGELVVCWQGLDEEGVDLFCSVYDPANAVWSEDLRLTEDPAIESAFEVAFDANGTLHLVYNKKDPETDVTDLHHLTQSLVQDLSFDEPALWVETENPEPGQTVELRCRVINTGALAVTNARVVFYHGDPADGGVEIGSTPVMPSVLAGGAAAGVNLDWVVPAAVDLLQVYAALEAGPGFDAGPPATLNVLEPDLEVVACRVEPRGEGLADVVAVIRNNGWVSAHNVQVAYGTDGQEIATVEVPVVLPGQIAEVTHTLWADTDFDILEPLLEVTVDPLGSLAESDEENNQAISAILLHADVDLDGMPDQWEGEHFGTLIRAGGQDFDQDGLSDYDEFVAGTVPIDPEDRFQVESIQSGPGIDELTIEWPVVEGRVYTLSSSTNLSEPWTLMYRGPVGSGAITITNLDYAIQFLRLSVEMDEQP